jgi:uncharacterized protein (DUF305 family)
MILFSRSFIRKRMISLATTASVTATSFALAEDSARTDHAHSAMPIRYVADWTNHSEGQPVLSENDAAMNKMMMNMAIKPIGDVDQDFGAMMVPHHGAVDIAKAELKYGHNEQLRRLAQDIVTTQQQEIMVMRNAVSEGLTSAAQSPKQPRARVLPQSVPIDGSVARGGMEMSQ